MPLIIEILQEDHRNIETLLLVLESELTVFMRGERPDYELLRAVITYFLDYPDQCHHPKEDFIFTALRTRNLSMEPAIDEMNNEHKTEAERLHRFARVVNSIEVEHEISRKTFADAVHDFTIYQRAHITKEEHTLFPACLSSLLPEDWATIDAHICDKTDPIFNGEKDQEFGALRQRILQWAQENEAARNSQ
jgi:hemerythrin-like domain-containing protein